ncbi:WD40-repeat-containing domain protein [Paraphoma chrysanthemicola]|uniref:WD40-repeat-containing domain protein n=1 Tax=Paraphoma chrysanthemicola TaxID=798071 RepID=A0A8K0QY19_9PLEO|nr:WD40-repeat-containing domain protein [Paraphoma chrysanthemicola]
MLPSGAELVARFLRTNGYTETLHSFVLEAGLPPDVGANPSDATTIESILQEKQAFDTSLNFEKLGLDDGGRSWAARAPSQPTIIASLPSRSNILSVSVFDLSLCSAASSRQYIAVTTADRKLHLLDPSTPNFEVNRSYVSFQDSPILDVVPLGTRRILAASMSGRLVLYDTVQDEILEERKDHSKYIVKVATFDEEGITWVATAGWDSKIFLYRLETDGALLGQPTAELSLPSIPEALVFVTSPEDGSPLLLVTRRDCTFLFFYTLPSLDAPAMELLGKQNLAPHSNAWISFTPSDVQLCPCDSSVVAIATSTTPHMKLLVVRLLIPTKASSLLASSTLPLDNVNMTQASQARAELLIQDREEASIMVNVSTLAPQTQYSTPRLVWRPDGTGIYVSSDDGVVRGIEASTGKLMATLAAHEPGSKLRCLWAGNRRVCENSQSEVPREFLISGGFDQKLIAWHA